MWKRLVFWAGTLTVALFALREGHLGFGIIMLLISVGSIFLWILKIGKEWGAHKTQIKISEGDVVVVCALGGLFVLEKFLNLAWLTWGIAFVIILMKISCILKNRNLKK